MADDSISPPTSIRFLNEPEWAVVQPVFGDTLPYRRRIWITNALGLGGAPFTIPTSMLSTIAWSLMGLPGTAVGYLGSVVNVGYLMNVGNFCDSDMSLTPDASRLLVHEMTHVWQGKNSVFALTYVFSSVLAQCKGMIAANGSLSGRNAAYGIGPSSAWGDLNAEQQASTVEQWYVNGMNSDDSDPLWPYIRDFVRQGKTS